MWERHARSRNGTRDEALAAVIAHADAAGDIDRLSRWFSRSTARTSTPPTCREPRPRPIGHDREICEHRNVVEGSFALLEQWRARATRYDEHALTYRSAVVLAAGLAWSRARDTRPGSRARMTLWTHSHRLPTSVAVWLP